MTLVRALTAAAALCAAVPAFAAAPTTLIDFEGVTSFASVGDYYNGGTDSAGVAGSSVGVSFTGAALALANDALGPYFSNAPTPGSVMFASDPSALLNFAKGFTAASFWYSSAGPTDLVTVYSGLDGTGSVLGSMNLAINAQSDGCVDSPLCHWELATLSFGGAGRSIGFGGNPGATAFDNIAITAVPEAQTWAMLMAGLVGVAAIARRRRW